MESVRQGDRSKEVHDWDKSGMDGPQLHKHVRPAGRIGVFHLSKSMHRRRCASDRKRLCHGRIKYSHKLPPLLHRFGNTQKLQWAVFNGDQHVSLSVLNFSCRFLMIELSCSLCSRLHMLTKHIDSYLSALRREKKRKEKLK